MRFPWKQTSSVAHYMKRMKKSGRSKFPLVLQLEPLHACNLSCSGCGRIREYKDLLSEMLPIGACLNAIDECQSPVVSICGGEPLLYPDIKQLVEKTLERGRVVYLCTNGQILSEKLPLFKPSKMFNINVHIDGLAKTHDAIVEKLGAFDKAVNGIVDAKKSGFTVCTNTTLYKQTDAKEIKALFDYLEGLGVDGLLISPGFDYSDVSDQSQFLTREAIIEKFAELRDIGRGKKVWSTPLFLDFLAGRRDYPCTPWGVVTYNVAGWKAPCYLITDTHHARFKEFMEETEWNRYGPGLDPRCKNCMCHCGFEPTVALTATNKFFDALTMTKWTLW